MLDRTRKWVGHGKERDRCRGTGKGEKEEVNGGKYPP